MSKKLSKKDRKILQELEINCRQSAQQIAKKAGVSRQVVEYTAKKLEREGIIAGYKTIINLRKLGYSFNRIIMKLNNVNPEISKSIVDYARTKEEVGWIVMLYGENDLGIGVFTKTDDEFEKIYDEIIEKFGKFIYRKTISKALCIYHFLHNFIYNEPNNQTIPLGQDSKQTDISEKDGELLNLITDNARASYAELSEKLSISPLSVRTRMKELINKGVILGFSTKYNIKKFRLDHYKIYLEINNLSHSKFNRLYIWLRDHKNVIYITKPFGEADFEFELIIDGQNKLYEFMEIFKAEFKDIIKTFRTDLIYDEPLVTYEPSKKF